VEEAVEKLGFGAFQIFIAIFAGAIYVTIMNAYMHKYLDTINGTTKYIFPYTYVYVPVAINRTFNIRI